MLLKVGELAKHAGLTVRTLHHYDQIGLLQPSARSTSGFRLYDQGDVERLHRIQALKHFGCSLEDIRSFLERPDAPIGEILAQQMRALEEQIRRARSLYQRLKRLGDQIARGETTGLTDWLAVLEMMNLYEGRLSRDELDRLLANWVASNLDAAWAELAAEVGDAMSRGTPAESRTAQSLAWRWMGLLRDATGNDAGLAMKLRKIHHQEQKISLFRGSTPEMIEFLTEALLKARAALLAKYLTPAELSGVLKRLTAQMFQWPPLIGAAQRLKERGAEQDDPEVQALAQRWEKLFRKSYAGADEQLAEKIRSAFRNEPDLSRGIGIDRDLIAFMERAINERHAQPGR